jgi:hypothetical protein
MRLEPPDIEAIAELVVERHGPQAGRMKEPRHRAHAGG